MEKTVRNNLFRCIVLQSQINSHLWEPNWFTNLNCELILTTFE